MSDADDAAIMQSMPGLICKLKNFNLKDNWNADECSLFYILAPDKNIAPSAQGRKRKRRS